MLQHAAKFYRHRKEKQITIFSYQGDGESFVPESTKPHGTFNVWLCFSWFLWNFFFHKSEFSGFLDYHKCPLFIIWSANSAPCCACEVEMENWITSRGALCLLWCHPPIHKCIWSPVWERDNGMIILQNVTLCFRLNCRRHSYVGGYTRARLFNNTSLDIVWVGVSGAAWDQTWSGCWAVSTWNVWCYKDEVKLN